MEQTIAKVLRCEDIAQDIFLLELFAPGIARSAAPGQFVHVAVPGAGANILRRPISLMGFDAGTGTLSMAIQVKGEGTKRLRALHPGDTVDVLGPIGRGFELRGARRAFFIGGGVGVAPVRGALDAFSGACDCEAFFGYRGKAFAYGLDGLSCPVHVATDDGTLGESGIITAPLLRALDAGAPDMMFACGPAPMLRAVQRIALERNIPCQLSLEERMGCGLGACLVCNCKVRAADGFDYRRVCVDGPVFDAGEVLFDD